MHLELFCSKQKKRARHGPTLDQIYANARLRKHMLPLDLLSLIVSCFPESPGDIYPVSRYDECDENYVIEHFCEGEVSLEELPREEGSNPYLVTTTRYNCPNGCLEGVCVESNVTVTCEDSDGGKDYYQKGYLTRGSKPESTVFEDYCLDSEYLIERYCSEDPNAFTEQHLCEFGCNKGVCIDEWCGGISAV